MSFPNLEPRAQAYCTDDNLRRLLVSRGMNVDKAFVQLEKTLKWRESVIPEQMVCQFCKEDPGSHDLRQIGVDAECRPVFYACFSQAKERTHGVWQHLVSKLESVIRLRDSLVGQYPQLEQWIWIIDFHGFTFQDCDLGCAKSVSMMVEHYPERLHKMLFLDAPFIFGSAWRIIRAVMDEKTTRKVEFVSASDCKSVLHSNFPPALAEWLLNEMRDNRLPRNRGGARRFWEGLDSEVRVCLHNTLDCLNNVVFAHYLCRTIRRVGRLLTIREGRSHSWLRLTTFPTRPRHSSRALWPNLRSRASQPPWPRRRRGRRTHSVRRAAAVTL